MPDFYHSPAAVSCAKILCVIAIITLIVSIVFSLYYFFSNVGCCNNNGCRDNGCSGEGRCLRRYKYYTFGIQGYLIALALFVLGGIIGAAYSYRAGMRRMARDMEDESSEEAAERMANA